MEESTLAQRNYLFDLHKRLDWPVAGLKNKSKQETSALIKTAKQALSQCPTQDKAIYRDRDTHNELGNDCARW